ncbi:hypothetical protein MRX96_004403 [Rhipicephalus microplus]
MPKEKAQDEYASLVDKLGGSAISASSSSAAESAQSQSVATGGDLVSSVEDKGFVIRFNRPAKKKLHHA